MKRVLAFPLMRLLLIVILFALLALPVALGVHARLSPPYRVALSWLLAALLVMAIAIVERFTVGKSLAAVGFNPRRIWPDLFVGIIGGAILFSLVILELKLGGLYQVAATRITASLILAALFFLADAAIEEMLFRGVIFRLIEEWTGTWIALAVSAVLFGLAHAANPGATWVSSLAIALEAGILLGATFVITRNLWLPIGLHFAWNFFEGPVYGAPVSGHALFTSAFAARLQGPSLLTGGSFGPEAGLAAIATCLVVAVALLVIAVRRSLIVPPAWQKRDVLPSGAKPN
jgi:uncharacterized protein